MKLKNLTVFFVLIVMIFSEPVFARYITSPAPTASGPDFVVKEFYKWYIHSISHQIDPLKAGKLTLRKYVMPGLILKTEKLAREMASTAYDGDYFLEAQGRYPDSPELEDEWTKDISVSDVMVRGATATVVIRFGENGKLARERISLLQTGGVWKIDSVKAIYPKFK